MLSQSFDSLPYPSVIGKHNTPTHCYCKSLMFLVLAVCFSLSIVVGVDYGQSRPIPIKTPVLTP